MYVRLVVAASAAAACYGLAKAGMIGSSGWRKVGELASLHVYPVKSCRGNEVDSMELDVYGATQDRRFMVVDEAGRFITQRQESVMARICVAAHGSGLIELSLSGDKGSTVVFRPVSAVSAEHAQVDAGVWDDSVVAVDQGKEVAVWLEGVLGRPARLVGMVEGFDRPTSRKYTPASAAAGGQTAFSDGFPLLLISEASLSDFNSRVSSPLPMNRFRPNLVVAGCGAYAEDQWRTLRIGETTFHVVKPCSRCKITTTDQETGYRGEEPLTTLSTYRRKQDVKAPCGDAVDVFFGQNICHQQQGRVSKGDAVYANFWQYPWYLGGYWHFC